MILTSHLPNADLEQFCSLQVGAELTPDIVTRQAPDALLLAQCDDRVQARVSLWWRAVPNHPGERLGFIGHYAARDARSAAEILSAACLALAAQGCTLAVGPIDGSTWRRYRLLTERGREPPFFLEPDNPDEWPGHFEAAGFEACARYYSSLNEDNARIRNRSDREKQIARDGYTVRTLAVHDIESELDRLWRLSSETFRGNLFYTPIARDEFHAIYAPLLNSIKPELVFIMERGDAQVAFCLAIPDLLQATRGQPIDTVIIKSITVEESHRGKGLSSVLLSRLNRTARSLGMHRTIHALMHEDNPSRWLNHGLMRDFRRYTLYSRRLSG
jgi:GNAT superfamily N-acetyltransferase